MKGKQIVRWEKIRKNGSFAYVFTYWFMPLGIFAPLFAQSVNIYMNSIDKPLKSVLKMINAGFIRQTLFLMSICVAAAILIGFLGWIIGEKQYGKVKGHSQTIQR